MNLTQAKFSIYYFLSISIYAFILAFFPIHCKVIGLKAFEIALVTASGTLATVFGPSIAIQIAHHFFSSRRVMIFSTFMALISYLPLLYSNSLIAVCSSWLFMNCFKRSADAIVDTKALNIKENFNFERARMWGSIGFICTMAIMGPVVDSYGSKTIVPFGMLLSLLVLIASIVVKDEIENFKGKDKINSNISNIFPKELIPITVIIILSFCLITASHSAIYIYLSLYLRALNWSASEISWAWNVGVIAEVLIFLLFSRFEKRIGLMNILWISTFITVLRWFILANAELKSVIFLSQLLHGFSFAGCYTAAVKLIAKILPESWKDRGQGFIMSFGFGIGAVFGRILMGIAAKDLDSDLEFNVLFILSGYIALASLALITLLIKINNRTNILEKKFD